MRFGKHTRPLRQMELSQAKMHIRKAEKAAVSSIGRIVAFAEDIVNGQMEHDLSLMNDKVVELVGTDNSRIVHNYSVALWFVKKVWSSTHQ